MNELKVGEHDVLFYLRPDSFIGAFAYLLIFVLVASLLSRALRAAVHAAMTRKGHIDVTTMSFLQQMGSALIWVIMLILYAHLIPVLRSMGTALLAGASVASVVIGLAAQSTLGNLVAGVSITIYRPFRLGDTLQVATPTGTDIGVVELISLGYTTLRATDGHLIVLPNAIAASQVTINLSSTFTPAPIAIAIHLSRDADIEAARRLALEVTKEVVDEKAIGGCYLTKVDATMVTLDLRLSAPELAGRDTLRSTLLAKLATALCRCQDRHGWGGERVLFVREDERRVAPALVRRIPRGGLANRDLGAAFFTANGCVSLSVQVIGRLQRIHDATYFIVVASGAGCVREDQPFMKAQRCSGRIGIDMGIAIAKAWVAHGAPWVSRPLVRRHLTAAIDWRTITVRQQLMPSLLAWSLAGLDVSLALTSVNRVGVNQAWTSTREVALAPVMSWV